MPFTFNSFAAQAPRVDGYRADDPDALRGVGLDGVVLDEAAFMKEEAWVNGIRPALSDRQGWAMFLTTPCGMNWIADRAGFRRVTGSSKRSKPKSTRCWRARHS